MKRLRKKKPKWKGYFPKVERDCIYVGSSNSCAGRGYKRDYYLGTNHGYYVNYDASIGDDFDCSHGSTQIVYELIANREWLKEAVFMKNNRKLGGSSPTR